jgi:hypothetical protein
MTKHTADIRCASTSNYSLTTTTNTTTTTIDTFSSFFPFLGYNVYICNKQQGHDTGPDNVIASFGPKVSFFLSLIRFL